MGKEDGKLEYEVEEKGYWYCPECKEELCNENVTYQELHDTCGTVALWKSPQPTGDIAEALERISTLEINITKRLEKGGVIKVGEMILANEVETIKTELTRLQGENERLEQSVIEGNQNLKEKISKITKSINTGCPSCEKQGYYETKGIKHDRECKHCGLTYSSEWLLDQVNKIQAILNKESE